MLGDVFSQVAVPPADVLGLAEEHVEEGAFVAGLVSCGEQFVGEGLVEQTGHRAGVAVGCRGLEQIVGGRRTAQRIEIGNPGVIAEGVGEGEPGRVVQPSAPGIGQRSQQLAVAFRPLFWPVQVFAQRLPDPGRNAGRIEALRGRVSHSAGSGQRIGG